MNHFDAIVIGAGPNGLSAGGMLAQAGRQVLVLERAARPGGALFTESRDRFLFSSEGYASRFLDPTVMRTLDLASHGLKLLPTRAAYALGPDGAMIALTADGAEAGRALAGLSPADAERLGELKALVERQAALRIDRAPPPKLSIWKARRGGLVAAQQALASLGRPAAEELLLFWSVSLGDLLDEYLTSGVLKAMIALRTLVGTNLGPYAPGTASRLLGHPFFAARAAREGLGAIPAGGGSALAEALVSALNAAGGTLRLNTAVSAVLLENGHAAGVVLENGEEIRADFVLSSLDMKRTFMTLFNWDSLPKPFLGRVAKAQAVGTTAKLDLALDEAPVFPALPEDWADAPGDIFVVKDLKALDQAHRRWISTLPPDQAPLIVSVPSLIDRGRAPARHHVMSVLIQYVPGVLFDGPWTTERRQSFVSAVFDQLKAVSPGLTERVRDMRLLLPPDIEAETGITGGSLFHTDMLQGQMPLTAGAGDPFRTPVPGLFLCDGGAGGLSGDPGARAAKVVLAAITERRR